MARLNITYDGTVADPSLVLMTKSGKRLGPIVGFDDFRYQHFLNQADEISITIHKYIDGERNPIWDDFLSLKVLWYSDVNQCFELDVETTDDDDTIKQATGTALAESELGQLLLFDTEINTEDDIARDDYTSPTIFYNPSDTSASLLNRVLSKAPHYSIAHVDGTLRKVQRTFSFDNTSIIDALNDIAEEVGCLFQYDSGINTTTGKFGRTISAYDLMNSCRDCGRRFEGTVCPKCGSTDYNEGYGGNTGIVITKENLADNINYTTDTDAVKNCFRLVGGDDETTAMIRACNPNGSNYIWNITDEMKADMTSSLVKKLNSYDSLYQQYATTQAFSANTTAYNAIVDKYIGGKPDLRHIYSGNASDVSTTDIKLVGVSSLIDAQYTILDLSAYLQTTMMPKYDYRVPTAQAQCNTIKANVTSVAVTNVSTASADTVEIAVKSLAKLYAHTEVYRVEVSTKSYASQTWTGVVTLTNYGDDTDTASTGTMTVSVNATASNYASELVQKKINEYVSDQFDIASLFKMNITNFKIALTGYSLDCLKSFAECCQACISVLVDQGAVSSGSSSNSMYTTYYDRLKALEAEIKLRSQELATVGTYENRNGLLQTITNLISKVHKALDLESYLGTTLWNELIAYRREQEYSNSNYRADGLTDAEMFQNVRGFYEAAEAELYKASHLQHSISAPLKNLLAMPEFEGLTDNFEVGNWIYVVVDEKPYKLRLVSYEIDFDDIQNIDVEFSDLLEIKTGASDLKSLMDSTKSMATSYGMVYKQAAKGETASKSVSDFYATGINGAKIPMLSNATSQDMQFGDSGLLSRRWIEEEQVYSQEQCRLTNTTFAFTDDGWQTCNAAIGKVVINGVEKYGVVADNIVGTLGSFATVSANNITTGILDASKVTVSNLSADSIISGTINASNVTITNISADNIKSGKIDSSLIDVDTLFAKNITATGSFQVNNGVYYLQQNSNGFELGSLNNEGDGLAPSSYIGANTNDGIVLSTNINDISLYANRGEVYIYAPWSGVRISGGLDVSPYISTDGSIYSTGATISGLTTISNASLVLKDTNFDISASSLSSAVYRTISVSDANDRLPLFIQAAEATDGTVTVSLGARRYNDVFTGWVNVDNRINLAVDKSGNRTVSVSDPSAWRTAIGVRSKTVNGTTASNGNISLGVDSSSWHILSVWDTANSYIATPFNNGTGNTWYAHVASASGSTLASTAVKLVVYYMAR